MKRILLFSLFLSAFSVNSEEFFYTTTCQFLIADRSRMGLLFESPSGCASGLAEQIKQARIEKRVDGDVFFIDTLFVSEYFEKAEPPKCPTGYLPVGDVKRRIVDASMYQNAYQGASTNSTGVLYEATRYCEKAD